MSDSIQPVSLFRYQAFENFFKRKSGDFERIPILAIGCFSLLANRIEQLSGFNWGHVVDLGKIGGTMSHLTDYWELHDFLNGGYKLCKSICIVYRQADLRSKEAKNETLTTAKKVGGYALKTFAHFTNFIQMMILGSALKGLNINHWKLAGSILGGSYSIHKLHESFTKRGKDPKDLNELKNDAKDAYRAQYAWRKFYGRLIVISDLALKMIGLCAMAASFSSAPKIVTFIATRERDLALGTLVGLTMSVIGSHLYREQMKTFKQLNKAN